MILRAPTLDQSEEGYVLVAVIFMLVIFSLSLSVAVPEIAKQIQLDRERETIERGKQYERAIQLYYRKFHSYPPTMDALVKTNNIRFLRKKYIDPMTGQDDWRPILFGENKTPTAMGFFGQPLGGVGSIGASTLAGVGPSGGNASPAQDGGSFAVSENAGSHTGSSNVAGDTDSSGAASSVGGLGQTAATFGGAGIIGVSPASTKQSIMMYKKKNHYDEWEFTYDPLGDMTLVNGNPVTDQPPASSVIGIGSSAQGTGPTTSPGPSSPETTPPQQ